MEKPESERSYEQKTPRQSDEHRLFPSYPPPEIPDHKLLKFIGKGAYGEVWLARSATGSFRAVKVVYQNTFEDLRPYEREFRGILEFEPISRTHSAQVDILHVGKNEEAGYFYYVMELADDVSSGSLADSNNSQSKDNGSSTYRKTNSVDVNHYSPRTLRFELKQRGRLPPMECLQIAESLTDALTHLHAHGLVHRDIKPSNVIFVRGRAKLADIGLVAPSDATLTFVGTEGYVPPEGPGKVQADIYSLGKVLYEMATGNDRHEFPKPPREIEKSAEHALFLELNAILLKASEDALKMRYQSASELLADVRTALARKSVRRKHFVSSACMGALKGVGIAATTTLLVLVAFKAFNSSQEAKPIISASRTLPINFELERMGIHFAWRKFDISRDGKKILFVDPDSRLFLYADGELHPVLEELARDWALSHPSWSWDSKTFVVSGYQREPTKKNQFRRRRRFPGRFGRSKCRRVERPMDC